MHSYWVLIYAFCDQPPTCLKNIVHRFAVSTSNHVTILLQEASRHQEEGDGNGLTINDLKLLFRDSGPDILARVNRSQITCPLLHLCDHTSCSYSHSLHLILCLVSLLCSLYHEFILQPYWAHHILWAHHKFLELRLSQRIFEILALSDVCHIICWNELYLNKSNHPTHPPLSLPHPPTVTLLLLQMNATSWEQLMDIIDINGDGIVSIAELERWPHLLHTLAIRGNFEHSNNWIALLAFIPQFMITSGSRKLWKKASPSDGMLQPQTLTTGT